MLISYALSFLGIPYQWGGNNPLTGLDCSGLVCEILKGVGAVPHSADLTSQQLFNHLGAGQNVTPQTGAIAFYGESISHITHVAFCINDRLVVEAGSGGRDVVNISEAQSRGAVVRIRPLKYRKDLVAVLMPSY